MVGASVEGIVGRGLVPYDAVAHTGDTCRLLIDPLVGERLLSLTDIFELVKVHDMGERQRGISPLVGLLPICARTLCTAFDREIGHPIAGDPPLVDVLALNIPPDRGLEQHHADQLREW